MFVVLRVERALACSMKPDDSYREGLYHASIRERRVERPSATSPHPVLRTRLNIRGMGDLVHSRYPKGVLTASNVLYWPNWLDGRTLG